MIGGRSFFGFTVYRDEYVKVRAQKPCSFDDEGFFVVNQLCRDLQNILFGKRWYKEHLSVNI